MAIRLVAEILQCSWRQLARGRTVCASFWLCFSERWHSQVLLEAFIGECSGSPVLAMTIATLNTNGSGVGDAGVRFTAEDLTPFSGATVRAQWTLIA